MWNNGSKNQQSSLKQAFTRDKKVVDMRAWLQQKREAARNVLTFTPRSLSPNDQPPSVA
jgi:hypothetical protein